jgi:hypothetical protein
MSAGYFSTGRLIFIPFFRSTTATAVEYTVVGGNLASTTEANVQITLDYDILVRRFRVNSSTNSKAAATTIAFRDDGADVTGTAITVASSTVGEDASAALGVIVASGSKINFRVTPSVSGTLSSSGFIVAEVLT